MKRLAIPLLLISSLLVALGMIEGVLRLFSPSSGYVVDPVLGWRPAPHIDRTVTQRDQAGAEYIVSHTTDANGARHYSVDGKQPARSILAIGDSHSALPFANDQDMWYGVFARALAESSGSAVTVKVIGAGGYGTLQQLMSAQAEARSGTSPDILLHQFCANDFLNNDYDWERATFLFNQSGRRPYLAPDLVSVFYADGIWPAIQRSILGNLRLVDRVDIAWQRLQDSTLYLTPPSEEQKSAWIDSSRRSTAVLLSRLRATFPAATALMINCTRTTDNPTVHWGLNSEWPSLAAAAGFHPLTAPNDAIKAAEEAGHIVRHADGQHYNLAGNRTIGQAAFTEARPLLLFPAAP